jgi:hypothetical protein
VLGFCAQATPIQVQALRMNTKTLLDISAPNDQTTRTAYRS